VARLPRIPDLLTTANLACGVGAVLLASNGQLTIACGLLFLAALFDVFDGLAARALGGGTPLGAQLDSMADMVSFGLAPAVLVWFWAQSWLEVGYEMKAFMSYPPLSALPGAAPISHDAALHPPGYWIALVAVLWIPIASAWRLAKFNIDPRQSTGFLGLPTPANALFWVSLVLSFSDPAKIDHYFGGPYISDINIGDSTTPISGSLNVAPLHLVALFPYLLLGTSLVLGILMLSEVPLPSLKFSSGKWRGNEVIFLLISAGALLVIALGIPAVPVILGLYLLSPLWGRLFPSSRT
jgi:CDP-diacylglycerol--serine O-phosphatidyltransferase